MKNEGFEDDSITYLDRQVDILDCACNRFWSYQPMMASLTLNFRFDLISLFDTLHWPITTRRSLLVYKPSMPVQCTYSFSLLTYTIPTSDVMYSTRRYQGKIRLHRRHRQSSLRN